MDDLWWYLTRSSGVVATVLIVASLLSGLLFSARATGQRRRPKWWLDLHNYLGGLASAVLRLASIAPNRARRSPAPRDSEQTQPPLDSAPHLLRRELVDA